MLAERRLAWGLALFLAALGIPALILAWHAFSQLEWESFHRYRLLANAAAARTNDALVQVIAQEDARSEQAYVYRADGVDPLSRFPTATALPGLVGYFQIDGAGVFTSPLVPTLNPASLAASGMLDWRERLAAAEAVRGVLTAGSARVSERREATVRSFGVGSSAAPGAGLSGTSGVDAAPAAPLDGENEVARFRDATTTDTAPVRAEPDASLYAGRAAFERLLEADDARGDSAADRGAQYGNVADLKLSSKFEQKSRAQARLDQSAADAARKKRAERVASLDKAASASAPTIPVPARAETRTELLARSIEGAKELANRHTAADAVPAEEAVPEAVATTAIIAGDRVAATAQARTRRDAPAPIAFAGDSENQSTQTSHPAAARQVVAFERTVGSMSFEQLDAEHFVLFRTVWRGNRRVVQGALIAREGMLRHLADNAWTRAGLVGVATFLVAFRGDVVLLESAADSGITSAGALAGELLYRSRFSDPLGALEVVYGVGQLPLGASARFLAWVVGVLMVVLMVGCWFIYRFGRDQIRVSAQQQEFVAAVSHELKTPLTSIRMYSEMLKQGMADDDRKQVYYQFIHDESERLSRLINNVLELARLNRGSSDMAPRPMRVDALADHLQSLLRSQCEQAGFALEVRRGHVGSERRFLADEDALSQVLINLVDNAIKFTPADAEQRVEITLDSAPDDALQIRVRDFGRGVPATSLRRIFDLFYRAEDELTRETAGTGIGLALVSRLVADMGGSITVENRTPGAEFIVTLAGADADTGGGDA